MVDGLHEKRVCIISSRHSFRYHENTYPLMCRSKGRHLLISLSCHTCISFILNPLPYNIMYPSWHATSYGCPSFMVLAWSYHWWFKYSFASMPFREWTYNNPWYTLGYCCSYWFGKWNTFQREVSHLFSHHTQQWMDIFIIIYGFKTLINVIITNLTRTDMVQQTLTMRTRNDDGYSRKDAIIRWVNIKWWLLSSSY